MASMVAKVCESASGQMGTVTVQEKGSRNKRKFRTDPPLVDPNKTIPLPSSEFANFEFSAEKFDAHGLADGCGVCCTNQDTCDALKLGLGLSFAVGTLAAGMSRAGEEMETSVDEFHDADWSDLTESELEELVLKNLDTIFKGATKKIVDNGYSEEAAAKAILTSGLWYGCKDMVSNIVDNTLAFLKNASENDTLRGLYFEDLHQMEKYVLAELVCLLREVRPFFSTGDAMWCLLIYDMNVSHACAMDDDLFGSFLCDKLTTKLTSSESNDLVPCKLNKLAFAHNGPKINESPSLKSKRSFIPNGSVAGLDSHPSTSRITEKPFTATGVTHDAEEKSVGLRNVFGMSKREAVSSHKLSHSAEHHPLCCSGGMTRVRRLSSTSSTNSLPTVGSSSAKSSTSSTSPVAPFNVSASLPAADTELSLAFPGKCIADAVPISYSIEAAADYSCLDPSDDDSSSQDEDELAMKLVPRVKELQNQLHEWTEWTNQKVMQAARRLSKDRSELNTLKQEKEESERLKKEKQSLEETTAKKLLEMEIALRKASMQMERVNAVVHRLEIENSRLRQEMEAAKLHAAESAATCREVLKREKKTQTKFQSWEKQKTIFQEELSDENLKLTQLQQKLQQAKGVHTQVLEKLNQEEETKEELIAQISSTRKQREQIELAGQSKEDKIKSRGGRKLQKYKEDIVKLEKGISQLRLKMDSSKIAALRRGINGKRYMPALKASTITCISKMASTDEGVKRERECVMCLSEEMSVVFLPCAHQVVCVACNELHEKKGMKECLWCRRPIEQRIRVRYAAES